MKNSDMPAMPSVQTTEQYEYNGIQYVQSKDYFEGLTKREHFAGLVMQGMLANKLIIDEVPQNSMEWIAEKAVCLADALLAEIEKGVSK